MVVLVNTRTKDLTTNEAALYSQTVWEKCQVYSSGIRISYMVLL